MNSVSSARKVVNCFCRSVPLVAYETSDPFASVKALGQEIRDWVKEDPEANSDDPTRKRDSIGVVCWDVVRGTYAGVPGDAKAKVLVDELGDPDNYVGSPVELLAKLGSLGGRAIFVLHNMQRFLDSVTVIQAVSNLRDVLKTKKMILVLMGTGINLPVELQHDVQFVNEPLPTPEELRSVIVPVLRLCEQDKNEELIDKACRASVGVTKFAAENLSMLSLVPNGLDVDGLWDSKAKKINQTPGLKVVSSGSFDSIGGVSRVKDFMRDVLNGKSKPNCIVYLDEIEKAFGGLAGDTSGTTQDQLGVILQEMQDTGATGTIFYGVPGGAKSAIAKAAGVEAQIPTIQFDIGATKGSLVGQSQAQIREALKVINAVSGGKTLWIATCNSMAVLPPELKRRFNYGTWFFDLPGREERDAIWDLYLAKYGVEEDPELRNRPWTGAEIETCCKLAFDLSISVTKAALNIVPIATSGREQIESLRTYADGRLLSASYPGVFERNRRSDDSRELARTIE